MTVNAFWDALAHQREWFTEPRQVNEHVWKMTAKWAYCFDDAFWAVFHRFPFTICHVSYSGAPWSLEGGPPEMVLRFVARGEDR